MTGKTTRETGRISDWRDDRGFGFVAPYPGGPRSFVHLKAFARGSRRPVEGDLISYRTGLDERGRSRAIEARFAGQRTPPKRLQQRTSPRIATAVTVLLGVVAGALLGVLPHVVAGAYLGGSIVAFALYAFDKAAAGAGRQRTPENTLHFIAVLGGWPGALAAQQAFRHKTAKPSFQWVFWMTVIVNLAAVAWLMSDSVGSALMDIRFWG